MNTFKITIDGKNFDVTVNETDKNIATVEVNGASYQVCYENCATTAATTIQRPTASARPVAAAAATTSAKPATSTGNATSIKSPLPGTILVINVKVGDQVKRGDVLLVMEAMKMENNIMASKDGQIKAIHVTTGQTVAQDDALIDLA